MQTAPKQQERSVDIRRIDIVADAEAMRALYAYSLGINNRGFVQDMNYHGDIVARAEKYQTINGDMIGAFVDGKLAGFGGLARVSDSDIELGKLHLHPDYQGLGIGRKMAEHLVQRARALGYAKVSLHVTVTQEAAIGLYRKLGFQQVDRRICTVGEESFDTIFMELPLA